MNPVLHWVVPHTGAVHRLRRCQRFGHSQTVSSSRAQEAVPCQRCSTAIPPAPASRR